MDRASVERLRFDRRLSRRRDWVEESEVEQYLESLPDVSGKMATIGDLEAEAGSEAAESATAEQAAPASESFGGSTSFGGGGFGGAGSA